MKLSEGQIRFFETFGFLQFPGLFADEIKSIIREFERLWDEHGSGHAGKPHDYQQLSSILPFIDQNEYLCGLLDDPRITGIAGSLLGDEFSYSTSDGHLYVGDTNWHSDLFSQSWAIDSGYLTVKMAFYLDAVGRESGCLRVIPGSHLSGDRFADGLQEAAPSSRNPRGEELWGVAGHEVPAVALESKPGDLLLFNHRIKHAAFGGGGRRRMFTINLEQRYRDKDLPRLREAIAGLAKYWPERAYGDLMIRTANPARMRHLEQRLANDGHLGELSRKARAEMSEPSRR